MNKRNGTQSVTVSHGDWIGARGEQQDRLLVQEIPTKGTSEFVLAVADGVGGSAGGGEASSAAITAVSSKVATTNESPDGLVASALVAANYAVLRLRLSDEKLSHAASTLTVATLTGRSLHWASIGDSLLLQVRGQRVRRLNADHSRRSDFDALVKKKLMTAEEARSDPRASELTAALNGQPLERVDIGAAPFRCQSGDTVILATDGLLTLSFARLSACLQDGDAQAVIDLLKSEARPRQDNVAVIVARFV